MNSLFETKAERNALKSALWTSGLGGIGVGALIMFFSDPDRGRRRRALVRDRFRHWAREVACAAEVVTRDLGNRIQGMRARARHLVSRSGPTPDVVIEERVRARLGRATTHPRAVKVLSQQGWVNLSGSVLASEKEAVLDAVRATPGVAAVADNMQVYDSAEHIPSLQGSHELQRARSMLGPDTWSPSVRALAAVGGCTLGCYGLIRRSPANIAVATLGFGLMAAGMLVKKGSSHRRHESSARRGGRHVAHRVRPDGADRTEQSRRSMETRNVAEDAIQRHQTSAQPGTLLH